MLTKDLVLELWSKTYNTEGNPTGRTFFPITIIIYISGIPFRKYVESKNLQQ